MNEVVKGHPLGTVAESMAQFMSTPIYSFPPTAKCPDSKWQLKTIPGCKILIPCPSNARDSVHLT